jgi:SAM-dependent methyltransferase
LPYLSLFIAAQSLQTMEYLEGCCAFACGVTGAWLHHALSCAYGRSIHVRTLGGVTWTYPVGGSPARFAFSMVDSRPEGRPARYVAALADRLREGQRVLMLGLGGGALPHELLRRDVRVRLTAVDVEPAALAAARAVAPERAGWEYALAEGALYVAKAPAASFDVVINDAFEWERMPADLRSARFLRDAARALAPGGLYVVNACFAGDERELANGLREAGFLDVECEPVAGSGNTLVFGRKCKD